jgi:4-amino-4-deoxy-L-arabinose transferase-like glycosyltransferase
MYFVLFLVAINIFKLATARFFPLIGDESFYWLWGQHLAFGYTAHPPMIAYVYFLLTALLGNNYLVIRFGAIAAVLLISWLVYLTGRELHDERTGMVAAVIFNLLPTFFGGGMFLVPQTILFLFWSWSFYLLVRLIKTGRGHYWYWLGLSAGLGLLSDHIMGLFFLATVGYCVVNRDLRHWFRRQEPYLAALISLLIFCPSLIWYLNQSLTPFGYWGGKMGAGPRIGDNLLNFFGLQLLLYTPPIFIMTCYLIFIRNRGVQPLVRLLPRLFSAIVFIPFLLISPIAMVGGHWPATAYLPAIIEAGKTKKWIIGTIIGFALFVNSLGFIYYIFLYPTPPDLRGKEFTVNQQFAKFIKESTPVKGRTFYLADDIGTFGLVSFHGGVKVYPPPGKLKEAEAWGTVDIKKGDNVIYFTREGTDEIYAGLKQVFQKVTVEKEKRLFAKDADIPTKMTIFHCHGYLGGKLP